MKDQRAANLVVRSGGARLLATAFLLAFPALLFLAGCATHKKDAGPKYNFFPPPPDAPRLQYLTAFNSDRDVRSGARDNFISFITGKQPGVVPILKPYGGFAGRGKIYVVDTADCVILRLDLIARKVKVIAPTGPAALKMPLNMTVDANDWLYIADGLRDQVVILDQNENLVATVGEKGMMKPRDVAVTTNRLYIGDIVNHCVHVLDKTSRAPLFDIPRSEDTTNIERKLFQPINIALDSAGKLYVSDFGAYRIQVYDVDGKYVRSIGKYGDNYGEFARPKGVAVDRDNRVYVADAAGQLVQIFDDKGQLLMWFGEPSASKVGLELPAKVLIDYDDVALFQKYAAPDFQLEHLVIVMNQYGTRKVSVFGFGHRKEAVANPGPGGP